MLICNYLYVYKLGKKNYLERKGLRNNSQQPSKFSMKAE